MSAPYVLIVDDVEINRLVIEKGIAPFPVEHAANAAQCLEHVFRSPPAVVLLDLGLPAVDGMAVLEILRQWDDDHDHHTPVIVITGEGTKERVSHAVGIGIEGFMVKPVDTAALAAKIRSLWPDGG